MRKLQYVSVVLVILTLFGCTKKENKEEDNGKKGENRVISLDLKDAVVEGKKNVAIFDYDKREEEKTVAKFIKEALLEKSPELHVTSYSGMGEEKIAIAALRQLDAAGFDLIITITSDALVIAVNVVEKTPCIFTNANNPLFLGFEKVEQEKRSFSGATYYVPVERQLELFLKLKPGIKKAGFIFDQNNKSMRVEVKESRNVCGFMGIEFIAEIVENREEMKQAAASLIERGAECVILTSSGLIYDNVELIKPLTDGKNIPIFSFNKKGVPKGAVAAFAVDYYDLASEVVIPMAYKALFEKADLSKSPYKYMENPTIQINKKSAETVGITIPGDILKKAVLYE